MADLLADRLRARRTGPKRWMARCPGHQDREPSLSICEGRDGRILLHCFAGCPITQILQSLGLRLADLFPGSLPSRAEAQRMAKNQEIRDRQQAELREADRTRRDRCRRLDAVSSALAARLARMPEGDEGDAMAALYHQALDKLRQAEAVLEVTR